MLSLAEEMDYHRSDLWGRDEPYPWKRESDETYARDFNPPIIEQED
jgi:hypothetical protein